MMQQQLKPAGQDEGPACIGAVGRAGSSSSSRHGQATARGRAVCTHDRTSRHAGLCICLAHSSTRYKYVTTNIAPQTVGKSSSSLS